MVATEKQIETYMQAHIEQHRGDWTGEIFITALARDACDHFDAWVDNEIPELFFNLASEVSEADTKHRLAMQFFAEKHINYEPDGDILWA